MLEDGSKGMSSDDASCSIAEKMQPVADPDVRSQFRLLQEQLREMQTLMERRFAELPDKFSQLGLARAASVAEEEELNFVLEQVAVPDERPSDQWNEQPEQHRVTVNSRVSVHTAGTEATVDTVDTGAWDALRATVYSNRASLWSAGALHNEHSSAHHQRMSRRSKNSTNTQRSSALRRSNASFLGENRRAKRSTLGSAFSRVSAKSNASLLSTASAFSAFGLSRRRNSGLIWDATKSQRQAAKKQAERLKARRTSSYQMDGLRSESLKLQRSNSDIQESLWRRLAGQVVDSAFVSYGVMLLVFVHVILLGIEVDMSASSLVRNDVPEWFSLANLIIVCIFVFEVMLKFIHLGCSTFWCGMDSGWNVFDFCIVSLSVADVIVDYWSKSFSNTIVLDELRVWRALRFARAIRSIRIIRVFRYIADLRTLVVSITATMSSLFWTLVLLLLIFYAFAIVITQLVAEHCRFIFLESAGQNQCNAELFVYWRSLPDSMLTLFMTVAQGIDWQIAMKPLFEVSSFAVFCMLLYVIITVFAILNVVTGVFCNTAIETASHDKEVATMKQVNSKSQQAAQLKAIFQEMDREDVKYVSIGDLNVAMEQPELQNFLESMGISTDDVWTLFLLLDAEEEGLIDLDAFVSGCMQMYGTAKSMQMAKLSYENMLLRQSVEEIKDGVGKELLRLNEHLGGTDGSIPDVSKVQAL